MGVFMDIIHEMETFTWKSENANNLWLLPKSLTILALRIEQLPLLIFIHIYIYIIPIWICPQTKHQSSQDMAEADKSI